MPAHPTLRGSRRFRSWWIIVPAWLAAWWFLSLRCEVTPFSGDESGWISSSLDATRRMLDGSWTKFEGWEPEAAGSWGSLNPPLGKWLIGIPLSAYCWSRGEWFDRYYDFWADGRENIRRGNIPPFELLTAARRIVAFYGSLAVLAVMWLGCRLRNVWVGLAAGGALLLDPLFQAVGTRVLTDVLNGLCLALVAVSLCPKAPVSPGGGDPRRFFLPGVLTGMLGVIKISSWAPVWLGAQLPLLVRGWRRREFWRTAVPPALVFGAGFGLAVYLLTPFLWPLEAPPGPVRIDAGRARIGLVSELPPLSADAGSPVVRAPADVARGILRFPELMLRWRRFGLHQASIGLGPWIPNRIVAFHRELGGTPLRALAAVLALVFCLITLWRLQRKPEAPPDSAEPLPDGRKTPNDGQDTPPDGVEPAAMIWGCLYLASLVFLPINLDRYYLPLLVLGYPLAVVVVFDALRRLRRR
jgi:hypothetical protein